MNLQMSQHMSQRMSQRMPLTTAQLGIWIGQQLDPASPAYWTAETLHLRGHLERALFKLALRQAIEEAESLHLRFASGDELAGIGGGCGIGDGSGDGCGIWQYVETAPWTVQEADFSQSPDPIAAGQAWMQQDLATRPDLRHGPLFACALLQLGAQHHLWYLRAHHIALDGFGHALLAARVAALYEAACRGQSPSAPRQPALAALVAEDQAYQTGSARQRDRAFWQARLASAAEPTLLAPATALAPGVRRVHACLDTRLDTNQDTRRATNQDTNQDTGRATNQDTSQTTSSMARWQELAASGQLDTGTLLQSAVLGWLAAVSGQNRLRCGLPQMLRLGSVALNLPCMAMNIVPLCIDIAPEQSLLQLAQTLNRELQAMRPHQRYRHEHMKQDMRAIGATRRLFGVVINWMPFDRPATLSQLSPLTSPPTHDTQAMALEARSVASGPVEDLAINLKPQADGRLQLTLEANPDAYCATYLQALLDSLCATLTTWLAQPHLARHELLIDCHALRTAALARPNDTPLPRPSDTLLTKPRDTALQKPGDTAIALLQGAPLAQPPLDVMQAFIAHAQAHPAQCALLHEGQALSYGQLLQAVCSVSAQLQARGVIPGKPGNLVASLLARGPAAIIGMLAILAAGAAFLPLDPAGPQRRNEAVLAQAQPVLALAAPADAGRFASHCRVLGLLRDPSGSWTLADAAAGAGCAAPVEKVGDAAQAAGAAALKADHPAYVIYTSGSTGSPNGVMIGRAALAHFVAAIGAHYALTPQDRVLQFAPLHFDACIEEIFGALCHGATLVMRDAAMLDSLPHFLQVCAAMAISMLDLPTAFWHELAYAISEGQATLPPCVRLVIIGGEAALPERLARWRASVAAHVVLQNTYGPTEATVICSSAELAGPHAVIPGSDVAAAGALPIGRPLPGMWLAVVDDEGQPCLVGEAGQLHIAGPTLAQGYLGRAALTAQRFRPLPALPQAPRWYQSGDRVVLGQDGQLRYLGRMDDELKISGHRVDPLEIETTLLRYPGVLEAAVVAVPPPAPTAPTVPTSPTEPTEPTAPTVPAAPTSPGSSAAAVLTAFIVMQEHAASGAPDGAALREFLAHSLPAPALPASFIGVPRLPRNRNGKIDRGLLRQQARAECETGTTVAATALEQRIMAVWTEVLGLATTPQDDFFLLGGKSLQAIQCANRLSLALQREVAVSTLFRHPVLADLAQSVAHCMPEGTGQAAPLGAAGAESAPQGAAGSEFAPLLTIQRGSGPTLFCLHPAEGLSWCYLGLTAHLPPLPIVGLQARGMLADLPPTIDAMLNDYLALIRSIQPEGPYYLLGWSSGGGMAHALATRLQAAGQRVALLALMDAYPATIWQGKPPAQERDALVALLDVIGASEFDATGAPAAPAELMARLLAPGSTLAYVGAEQLQRLCQCALHTMRLYRDLQHQVFDGDLLFFRATQRQHDAPDWRLWQTRVRGNIECIDIDSTHSGMSQRAPLAHIGRELAKRLVAGTHHQSGNEHGI